MSSHFDEQSARPPQALGPPRIVTMPGLMPASTAQTADALAPDDVARADRVARRLHSEIASFLNSLPPEARNASGLARFLEIDRTTCQRAVFAATRHYPGPDLLGRLPGIKGLQQMVEAARRADPPIDETMAASLDANLPLSCFDKPPPLPVTARSFARLGSSHAAAGRARESAASPSRPATCTRAHARFGIRAEARSLARQRRAAPTRRRPPRESSRSLAAHAKRT